MITQGMLETVQSTSVEAVAAEANLDALEALNFCGIWATVRQGLVILRDQVFGGMSPINILIRWVIDMIIRIIDDRCPA